MMSAATSASLRSRCEYKWCSKIGIMRTCSTEGCERKHYGRGLCKPCYLRAWTKGQHVDHPRSLVMPGSSLDERLRNIGWTTTPTGCWEWNGSRDNHGYGRLAVGTGVPMIANRAAYRAWVGELPDHLVVCHACDNPPCINPDHLFTGTRGDNNRDAFQKGRSANGENKPHKLTDEQVSEVRSRYAAGGIRQRDLADEYGVCQQLVSHLVRGSRRSTPTRLKRSQ